MISALLVKELREKSGAGMMDAKKALLKQMAIWKLLKIGSEQLFSSRPKRNRIRLLQNLVGVTE